MKRRVAVLFTIMMLSLACACGQGEKQTEEGDANQEAGGDVETEEVGETGEEAEETDGTGEDEADGASLDKSSASSYIGVWESDHMQFNIEKGGIGRYRANKADETYYDFTYEVKDDVFVMTIPSAVGNYEYVTSLELNDDGTKLIMLHAGMPTYYPETEFAKQ